MVLTYEPRLSTQKWWLATVRWSLSPVTIRLIEKSRSRPFARWTPGITALFVPRQFLFASIGKGADFFRTTNWRLGIITVTRKHTRSPRISRVPTTLRFGICGWTVRSRRNRPSNGQMVLARLTPFFDAAIDFGFVRCPKFKGATSRAAAALCMPR